MSIFEKIKNMGKPSVFPVFPDIEVTPKSVIIPSTPYPNPDWIGINASDENLEREFATHRAKLLNSLANGLPEAAFYQEGEDVPTVRRVDELPTVKEKEIIEVSVEQVHEEFDTAAEKVAEQAKEILNKEFTEEQSELLELANLGFPMAKGVQEVVVKQTEKNVNKEKLDLINYYREKYPAYKCIYRSDAINICQKYGLILGEPKNFIGHIPKKNRQELIKFNSEIDKNDWSMGQYFKEVDFAATDREVNRRKLRGSFAWEIMPTIYKTIFRECAKGDTSPNVIQAPLSIVATRKDFRLGKK